MDDHRKLYRRIFSIERFIRNLTRSISTMCDSATATGGLVGGTFGAGGATTANGVDMGAAVAAAAAAAAAAAHAAAAEQSTCGGGSGCGGTTAVGSAGGCVASSASALLAKRERRLRLQKVGSYRVGRTLGRGNFAQVRVAYHEVANAKVAMKIVDKRSLDEENLAKIEREIRILQQLSHPYIVRLYEVIRTERYLYIVTEYVSNGELFDMLMDRGRQTEAESRRLFQQIVSAVAYCHAHGIVHRDLKAENLLLDKRGNIKIIDFGFSNYHQPGQLLSTWCGSPPYAAPELLLAQEYDGRQSDVWSLGVILYILVTAGFPFPGDSVDKLKRAVLSDHLKIPFWVSVECADLIRKMLIVQPAKRCILQYITQHKWFTCDMPEHIKQQLLVPQLSSSAAATTVDNQQENRAPYTVGGGGGRAVQQQQQQLDPTVLIFMQQHTGWSDEQIIEEVLGRNYESSVFGTYALLLSRLSDIRAAEAVAAAAAAATAASASGTGIITTTGGTSSGSNSNSSSNGGIAAAMMASPLVFGGGGAARATATAMALNTIVGGSCTNLQLDSEYARRGSRGSIISGRANVEPAEQQHHATIPAHHLAKLSLSTSPDYQETDDSDSASDWSMVPNSSAGASSADDAAAAVVPPPPPPSTTSVSPTQPQHHHNHHHTAPCVAPPAASSSSSSYYKSKRHHHCAGRRGVAAAAPRATATPAATTQFDQQQQQRAAYVALEQQYHQLNPLLNAAAQQFAVDTSRAAWANAAAAAALFASQLQQQHTGSNSCSTTNSSSVVVISDAARHQLQQAAALNLVSLQNFPFVDYAARMMHVPTQERRASANEALLGLNSYAHLLAACSTMGGGGANSAGTGGCSTGTASSSCPTAGPSPAPPLSSSAMATDQQQQQQHSQPNTRCSSSHGTLSSSSAGNASPCRRRQSLAASANGGGVVAGAAPQITAPAGVHHQQHRHHNGARHPPPLARRSVEEEGEFYLCGQRGSGKRNTVHSITAGVPLLLGTSGHAQKQQHQQHQSAQSSAFQRHTRTPYAKQGSSFGTGVMGGAERRSSWASSSAGSPVLAINAQQHAQLERLYRQSIGQKQTNPSSSGPPSESSAASVAAGVSNVVQQLQHEFQKLCAASSTSTKEGSPPSLSDSTPQHHHNHHQLSSATVSANTIAAAAAAAVGASAQLLPRGAPTISITDENNRHSMFGGGVAATATVIAATTPYDRHQQQQHQQLLFAILEQHHQQQQQQTNENEDDEMVVENTSINNYNSNNNLSQSLPQQRPATVCGFSTTPSGIHTAANIDDSTGQQPPPALLKFVYIPVSIRTALERLQRVVDAHKLLCELQSDELSITLTPDQMGCATAENVHAIRVRVAPPPSPPAPPNGEQHPSSPAATPLSSATILELCLFRMDQSPNISRASFTHVQGDADQFEALRQTLLRVFNEVL